MKRRFRLIALDVDGTIRDRDRHISERTRSAIERARENGAYVTLATGRTFLSALSASTDLGLTCPLITFQGAHVAQPDGEVLWHTPLTSEMTSAALDALTGRSEFDVMAYFGNDVLVMEPSDWTIDYGERNSIPIHVVHQNKIETGPMTRLVVRGDDDAIESLEVELKARFDGALYVTRSLSYFCEILHPDAGKDKAIEWLCEYLDVSPLDTLAFGNGYNDIQMLSEAGLGVAVDGAVSQAIAVADFVAPSMEEDGVARVLEYLLDGGYVG